MTTAVATRPAPKKKPPVAKVPRVTKTEAAKAEHLKNRLHYQQAYIDSGKRTYGPYKGLKQVATLVAPTGVGKTYVYINIVKEVLKSNSSRFRQPIVIVCNPLLEGLKHQMNEWARWGPGGYDFWVNASGYKSDVWFTDSVLRANLGVDLSNSSDRTLVRKIRERVRPVVIFTTLKSVDDVTRALGKDKADFAVFDEAHRTVGAHDKTIKNSNLAKSAHALPTMRSLFVTATPRTLNLPGTFITYDMKNPAQYGVPLDPELTLRDAIDARLVSDYEFATGETLDQKLASRLMVTAQRQLKGDDAWSVQGKALLRQEILAALLIFMTIEGGAKKVLAFRTNIDGINNFSDKILPLVGDYLHKNGLLKETGTYLSIHSGPGNSAKNRRKVLDELLVPNKICVVTSCNTISEGYDCPGVDAICFVEPRASHTYIVQALGRGLRFNARAPLSKTKVILPVLNEPGDNAPYSGLWDMLVAIGQADRLVYELVESLHDSGAGVGRKTPIPLEAFKQLNLGNCVNGLKLVVTSREKATLSSMLMQAIRAASGKP